MNSPQDSGSQTMVQLDAKFMICNYIAGISVINYQLVVQNTILFYRFLRNRRRRRKLLHLKLLLLQLRDRGSKKVRRNDWLKKTKHFTDADYYENFRVSKAIFQHICDELRERLTPKENLISAKDKPNPVEKRVAVSLYYLATSCDYKIVGDQFGIHKTTVWKILHQFVDAVLEILTVKSIVMPDENEAADISVHFETLSHIPNILGAIDSTHIPISPRSEGHRDDFINQKSWSSIILQSVIDHKYLFRDISIKHPGSTHDAIVLKNSNLYENHKTLIPKCNILLDGHELPYVIIGNTTYPLLPWLLKGYTSPVDHEEDSFNVYLNSARVCVENAFGRLKARFRILSKGTHVQYSFAPKLVAVCCTLHNIIETRGGKFDNEWITAVKKDEEFFPQPQQRNHNFNDIDGHELRETLKNHLVANYPLQRSKNR